MIICKFQQFVNEKVGVAIPSTKYTGIISDKVKGMLSEFLLSDDKSLSEDVIIDSVDIFSVIQMMDLEAYRKFPVVGIELLLDFNKVNSIDTQKGGDWSVGGAANPFGHRNWKSYSRLSEPIIEDSDHGIIIKVDISIDITKKFKDVELLDDDINSTIWHELNHLYEKYNRFLNIGGRVLNRSLKTALSYSDYNSWKIKKEIFTFWNRNFLYYIYLSEPYEINARVQELAYYVIKYGFDYIKDKDDFDYARKLKEFNSDTFISELMSVISEHYSEQESEYIMNRLKRMFISEYKKTLSENNETPTINLSKIEKMSFEEFINFFQRRFNISGDRFFRRISKLSSLNEKV